MFSDMNVGHTLATWSKAKNMATAFFNGKMVSDMKASGARSSRTVMASISGRTAERMSESMRTATSTVWEQPFTPMEVSMKVPLRTERNMVMVSIYLPMGPSTLETM